MKRYLFLALLTATALSAQGQSRRDSLWRANDGMYYGHDLSTSRKALPSEVKDIHLWNAGVFQRKSATLETCAWVAGVASGAAFSGVFSKERSTCNLLGIGLGVASAAFLAGSLDYRMKSGAELKLSATGIRVTF